MTLKQRLNSFVQLGDFINGFLQNDSLFEPENIKYQEFSKVLQTAKAKNGWFTELELRRSLNGVSNYLDKKKLEKWTANYSLLTDTPHPQTIGVIMAGNIPLVGFHDFLSVLISGNKFEGKTSKDDEEILPFLANKLIELEPNWKSYINFTKQKFSTIDAVIATGSNNTSRYFEYYFGKYPNIIRKNRNSIAIIDEQTTDENIKALGEDVFAYYGLGCRNISKIYVPEEFNTNRIFENLISYSYVMENKKYANNHIYHQTVYLMNDEKLLDNGFLLLHESQSIGSPVGMLFFERYKNKTDLRSELLLKNEQIQAIISKDDIPFGNAQTPELWDYSDGIDTLEFLANLAHHIN